MKLDIGQLDCLYIFRKDFES